MRLDRNRVGAGDEPASEVLSKTKRKQLSIELQRLGLELSRLPPKELDHLDLDIELRSALDQARKIKPGGAFNRQIKFIGGLLRELEDVTPIREKLSRLKFQGEAALRRHHLLEHWRERLLADGDAAVEALRERVPSIDCQRVRQLVRNARKEIEQGKAPRSTRILYRYLGQCLDSP